jgi:hypothetical protein
MGQNSWEAAEIPLDSVDVIESLAKRLYNIEFVNESGGSIYPVEIVRTDVDILSMVMSDGTKFVLLCEEKGE